MDTLTARILSRTTGEFYRRNAASFSATRQAPWAGWLRAFEGPAGDALAGTQARILDVACGNLRFERFLATQYPACHLVVHALDSCPPLLGDTPAGISFRASDVVEELLAGDIEHNLGVSAYDLVACFGFMHHVPGNANRVRLLRALAGKVAPGGFLVVSFWQFMNSLELAQKAHMSHARGIQALAPAGLDPGQLEMGDYLLGWQDSPDSFRYCHHFDAGEIDALVQEAGLASSVVDSFEADGRTGNLNRYLVMAKAR